MAPPRSRRRYVRSRWARTRRQPVPWNAAGVIVYAISSNGLWRIPDTGGDPVRVTPAGDYGYLTFLPDGEHVLYTWFGRDPQPGVYIGAITNPEPRPTN